MDPVSPVMPGSESIEIVPYKVPGIIYMILNLKNRKAYIGQTISGFRVRMEAHKRDARVGSKMVIHEAIRKHGCENFAYFVVGYYFGRKELDEAEITNIRMFNSECPNGYNVTPGGRSPQMRQETKEKISQSKVGKKRPNMTGENHPRFGKPMPIETRMKLSITTSTSMTPERREELSKQAKGRRHSEATRRKISENSKKNSLRGESHPWHGRKLTEEEKMAVSVRFKGKPKSEETKRKIGAAQKGRPKPKLIGNTIRKDYLQRLKSTGEINGD